MSEIIKVGMADYKLGTSTDKIITLGLGSCVGVVIYDASRKIAGMAHIMLPSSVEIKNNSNALKFADTCIDLMLEDLIRLRGSRLGLKAKIAGGAQMFNISMNQQSMNIGARNVAAVKDRLKLRGIPLLAEDVLGNYGRTIRFSVDTQQLHIKSIGKGESIL